MKKLFLLIVLLSVLCTSLSLAAASKSPGPPPKLTQLFRPDILGATIAFIESKIGPAEKVSGQDREYLVDGCKVTITGDKDVLDIMLTDLSPKCSFDLNPFLNSTGPLPAHTLTFGKFAAAVGVVEYSSDCLVMCGNAFDPSVYGLFNGPRALEFLRIKVETPLTGDAAIKAASSWAGEMTKSEGEDWVTDLKFNEIRRYDELAGKLFKNVPIRAITLGHYLEGAESAVPVTKAKCPENALAEPVTVEGIYGGVECPDMLCYAAVKLANGEPVDFICNEEIAERTFGQEGNRISVTYQMTQYWQPEEAEGEGTCQKGYVFKSGKILAPAGTSNKPK